MKTGTSLRIFSLVVFLIAPLMFFAGCKDDDTTAPPADDKITEDLFPLVQNHQLVYSGMLRDKVADTNITATAAVYETKWTVSLNSAPTPIGGTANLVMDSTRVPTGVPSPPTIWVLTPLFVQRNPGTGTADMAFMQNIGPFYRRFGMTNTDTLKWFLLARFGTGYGMGKEWTAFDSTWTTPTATVVRLLVLASWEKRESLTLAGETFNTYKLRTKRKIYVGGTLAKEEDTATLWLAPGVGPVKMILNTDGENPGHFRELKSKNF